MQRLRSLHHKNRYTQIANDAIDALPDLESVGLLATILRHSDDFDFQMSLLIKSKPGLGEKRAYRARSTLIEYGYVVQVKFKHTFRGRFCTDIYRSAEPHAAEDLALLRERYKPGTTIALADEDDGQERLVTITWSEITSAAGRERVCELPPVDNSAPTDPQPHEQPTKSQVVPDPTMAGSGTAGPGHPGPGTAGPGKAGSFKEDWSESEKEDPDPDERTDEPASEKGSEAVSRIRAQLDLTRVDAQPKQVRQVESALELLLAAGFAESVIERHAQRKLGEANTCKYLITGLAPEHVVDGAPGSGSSRPASGATAGQPCGQCDARPGESVNARVVWRDKDEGLFDWCPRCHPKATPRP